VTEHGPQWIGIGSQRSGTTWFTDLLIQHPQVDVADGTKEHHVLYRFGLVREWNPNARRRYQERFTRDGMKLGEFTPYYLRSPWTPAIAREALPEDAPLIVLFRDPIDRFASSLRHGMDAAIRRYKKHRTKTAGEGVNPFFPRALPKWPKSGDPERQKRAYLDQVARAASPRWVKGPPVRQPHADRTWLRSIGSDITWGGMYHTQLSAWTALFPKDRFIVIQYERLRRDPQHYIDLVWKRLGLDPIPLHRPHDPSKTTTNINKWSVEDHPDVIRGLQRMYRPDAERLAAEWDIDLTLWKRTMNDV
jgi:hypothetical protein